MGVSLYEATQLFLCCCKGKPPGAEARFGVPEKEDTPKSKMEGSPGWDTHPGSSPPQVYKFVALEALHKW